MTARNNNVMLTQISYQYTQKIKVNLDPQLKDQLMKQLSPEDLSKIKKGFQLYKGKVTQTQFICLMIDALYIKKKKMQAYGKQVLTFIQLFLLIDLKNIGKIKFQDFTNYLIDRQKAHSKIQQYHFQPNSNLNKLDLASEKVFGLKNSPHLGLLQNNKKNVILLQQKTYKPIQNIAFGGVIINCIIYIPSNKVYCISTNDKFINFYSSSQKQLIRRFMLPDPIFYMVTHSDDSVNPKIIMGSTNGHLYQFLLKKILAIMNKKDKEAIKDEQKRKQKYPSHQIYKAFMIQKQKQKDKDKDKVLSVQPDLTCIQILQPLQLLITGSNDSKVRLYDIRQTGLHLAKQLDGHYKGIKGVAVSQSHRVIVSCSFDFDLLVWNAYLQHPVARLQGHQAPLVNVCCPNHHNIIISLDSKSFMKIWNCQNYQLIQNLVIFQNFPKNTTINFLYKNQIDVAIIYTKKLKFYQYVVSYNPRLSDDYESGAIRYSPKNLQIYIGSKRSIKVWSMEKGTLIRTYNDIIQSDIAIIQLDNRQRRLFVGSIQGDLISVDVFSGLVISKYSSHPLQISFLLYDQQNQLLISGAWDKKIKIHNDTQHLDKIQSRQNVLRNINNVSQKDLSGGSFSQAQMLISTHSKTNSCRIWDFQKGFLQAQFILPNQINLLYFLSPLPLLVICDIKGSIYIFTTKYHLKKPFNLLTQWKNMYSIQKTSQITFIEYKKINKQDWLILGDQNGYIRIIDITLFINEHGIKPVPKQLLGNKNPYRIQDYNYIGTNQLSVNIHDFTHYQTKVIVPPQSIKQKIQIKAHQQKIYYITLINQSQQQLILTTGADRLVKLWNYQGQSRGTLKQGLKQNINWNYKLNQKWKNKQQIIYQSIKNQLQTIFQQYLMKKRLSIIPFTQQQKFQQVNNDQIYRQLKQVDGYLTKTQLSRNQQKKKTNKYY